MPVLPVEVVLLHSQTVAASSTSGTIVVPVGYWGALLYLSTGTPTGTSPTLSVYIQQGFRATGAADTSDGLQLANTTSPTIWDDYMAFPQVTSVATTQKAVARIIAEIGTSASNSPTGSVGAAKDAALAASTINAGPFGMFWRIKWTVGGTSPSFPTVVLTAQFVMPQG